MLDPGVTPTVPRPVAQKLKKSAVLESGTAVEYRCTSTHIVVL